VLGGKLRLKLAGTGSAANTRWNFSAEQAVSRKRSADALTDAESGVSAESIKRPNFSESLGEIKGAFDHEVKGKRVSEDVSTSTGPCSSEPLSEKGGAPDSRTPAQRAFDEVQRKRLREEAVKMAAKSHRERVSELNEKLKKAPEHNDLFRISYGGQG